jgi:hypothetical protein
MNYVLVGQFTNIRPPQSLTTIDDSESMGFAPLPDFDGGYDYSDDHTIASQSSTNFDPYTQGTQSSQADSSYMAGSQFSQESGGYNDYFYDSQDFSQQSNR